MLVPHASDSLATYNAIKICFDWFVFDKKETESRYYRLIYFGQEMRSQLPLPPYKKAYICCYVRSMRYKCRYQ